MASYLDSGAANRPPAHPALRDRGMKKACRGGSASAIRLAVRLGARLDEPGTSVASIRALIWLVTQGRDAPDLLPLFFPSGPNAPLLARQLSQELRDEALLALLEGYNSPFSSQAVEEYIGFAGALLDAGASPDLLRGSRVYPTSALSAAVKTLSPDLVR
ncbi:hypothetical protein C8A05DRAFT_34138 [Staphylotrichum tortipilum]|uniref:Uncharacterized protein n=1 Tax=Staphylotrichum tortipilum TaxID=2831512 RepID=A0AAN6MJR4_9PEZI|nr:hypothetical protein C8A05DRAFT_34138 [Staphylotrichum longicolle]